MKREKTYCIFLAGLFAVCMVMGCGGNVMSGKGISVYYAAIESGDYYEGWAEKLGMQAQERGYGFDVGYAEQSVETQDAQVKSAAEKNDVLLCGPVSADIVTEIKAAAGDTPIVFLNNAPDDDQLEKDKYIYVASDEYMAGQYQAEYILDKFADKQEINVMILKGPKGASGTVGRTNGLKQTLKASGKQINYVFEDFAGWSSDTAKEFTNIFLKTGRPVDCVAANNDDMAIGSVTAFEEAGIDTSSILFLGVDASAGGCEAIAAGRMDFTAFQPMDAQMEAAVEAAGKLAAGDSIKSIEGATDDGKYILIPFEKVDASNVAQYQ